MVDVAFNNLTQYAILSKINSALDKKVVVTYLMFVRKKSSSKITDLNRQILKFIIYMIFWHQN